MNTKQKIRHLRTQHRNLTAQKAEVERRMRETRDQHDALVTRAWKKQLKRLDPEALAQEIEQVYEENYATPGEWLEARHGIAVAMLDEGWTCISLDLPNRLGRQMTYEEIGIDLRNYAAKVMDATSFEVREEWHTSLHGSPAHSFRHNGGTEDG